MHACTTPPLINMVLLSRMIPAAAAAAPVSSIYVLYMCSLCRMCSLYLRLRLRLRLRQRLPKSRLEGTSAKATVLVNMQQLRG